MGAARCYDYINRLEADFAKWLGVKHAVATSSCTGALHMGLHALGIGPGDEVILADTNWIASVAPVVHLGATPVFVDILEDSWCLDPAQVEAAITSRTKAILSVHLYGNLCDMDRLRKLASDRGITLIEDAAEAIGSVWKGARAGSMGKFGVFSFHGTKTVTTGKAACSPPMTTRFMNAYGHSTTMDGIRPNETVLGGRDRLQISHVQPRRGAWLRAIGTR